MSPAQRYGLKLAIEEVFEGELQLVRMRRNIALVRGGVHPQLPLIDALISWGAAVQRTTSAKTDG